jgi:DNA-nicking Smr family endonuclease
VPPDTLDGSWERRLKRGLVAPERSVDLHGETLATAYATLQVAIGQALADEVRVLLVVTGRAPKPGNERRGLIRAAIGDWIAGSPYAGRIAAVRAAHPRHGGAGALYLILRRRR